MFFCKPLRNKSRFQPHRRISDKLTFTEFEKAGFVHLNDWNEVVKHNNPFLELEYLKLIESCGYIAFKSRYVIVYEAGKPIGVLYFQVCKFDASVFGKLLEEELENIKSKKIKLFEKYVQSKDDDEVLFLLLTLGNNIVSGEHGFLFDSKVDENLKYKIICSLIQTMSSEEGMRGKIAAVLLKDFEHENKFFKSIKGLHAEEFMVEPNMVLEVPNGVHSIQDYITLFSKKYRNRAKQILNKRSEFSIRELNYSEVLSIDEQLFSLYSQLFNKAKFKLLKLPVNYFSELKRILTNRSIVKIIECDNQIIGFLTAVVLPDKTLEAHYIGMDYELNPKHEIYQNILYAFIETAIENNCKKVNFGRTASEIKSTIGAVAEELLCYIKPQNAVSNLIVKPFINFLQPKPWIARNPFKESE
ncbi:MAG: hypothetical protein AB7O73_02265 [Bacteroidia bacterium]